MGEYLDWSAWDLLLRRRGKVLVEVLSDNDDLCFWIDFSEIERAFGDPTVADIQLFFSQRYQAVKADPKLRATADKRKSTRLYIADKDLIPLWAQTQPKF